MPYRHHTDPIFSAENKIGYFLDGLKSRNMSKTSREWNFSRHTFFKWYKVILEGAKINFQKNYHTCNHPVIVEFRNKLLAPYLEQRELIQRENENLKAQIQLLKPHKRGRQYSMNERKKIIEYVKTSPFKMATILRCLQVSTTTFRNWKEYFKRPKKRQRKIPKEQQKKYIKAVFKTLHSPPKTYGINRTSWRINDLYACLNGNGTKIGRNTILSIIKNAGYRFRMAKQVLTSRDSYYELRLQRIQKVLRNLRKNEGFFSIDEFGPFSVKKRGGKKLVPPGLKRKVETIQKTKGVITLVGALELSTNQMTYLEKVKPNTESTIALIEMLKTKYSSLRKIFLSWDSSAYHTSKRLFSRIEELNKEPTGPKIVCTPLPAGSQFLNIIESVYGGMYRAVLENSDFTTRRNCLDMIESYFLDRNEYYRENPKRAGKKIWNQELTKPVFKVSNNCVEKQRWTIDRVLRKIK